MDARHGLALALGLALSLLPRAARALDKQGSAHGGSVSGATSGFDLTGSAGIGASVYNPSYAARPDNTGLALMRYLVHADIDLIGTRLSIPIDVSTFTDRERHGALKLVPTELDFIAGITSTWGLGPSAVELGFRVETDRPLDRGTYSQSYADFRARYLFSLAERAPSLRETLGGGDITGHATLGVFAINPTYAARPDNSGRALFRYGLHGQISFWHEHAAVGLDATMFTDRHENVFRPSELDLTPELVASFEPFAFHLAYERDMPLDDLGTDPGFVQQFVYVLGTWAFDLYTPPEPLAVRN